MSSGASITVLRLECQPGKTGNMLVFPYAVENQGPTDAYVMDATANLDPIRHVEHANDQTAVVILDDEGNVILGKFIAPLPSDRRIAVPVIPLARRLPVGARLERLLEIPVPLAEISPYFADLPLRQYEITDIKSVIFAIGYWHAGIDGLVALPVKYAPDLFAVTTRHTMRSAVLVTKRFPTKGLQLFKRRDAFQRQLEFFPPPGTDGIHRFD